MQSGLANGPALESIPPSPGMNNDVLWLIRLGLDQKLFNRDQALTVIRMLGVSASDEGAPK